MYFLEDTCMPSDEAEISFCEDTLELNVLNHKALNILGIYEQEMYVEDGEGSSSSDGVFQKLQSAILSILGKIGNIVTGFLDGMKVFSKNRITYGDYINSETGQIRLSDDLFAIQKKLDDEYRRMRPVISKIAQMTDSDIEQVEKICDTVTENIHNYGRIYGSMAVQIVEARAINELSNHIVDQMKDVQQWRAETEASIKRMQRETSPKKMKTTQKAVKTMGDLATAYKDLGNRAKNALQNDINKKKGGK